MNIIKVIFDGVYIIMALPNIKNVIIIIKRDYELL